MPSINGNTIVFIICISISGSPRDWQICMTISLNVLDPELRNPWSVDVEVVGLGLDLAADGILGVLAFVLSVVS